MSVDGPYPDDPVERVIYDALHGARISFKCGHRTVSGLDSEIENGPAIECKRLFTERVVEQMSRREDVIVIQGMAAAQWFASLLNREMDRRLVDVLAGVRR